MPGHNCVVKCELDVVPTARTAAPFTKFHASGGFENYRLKKVCVVDKSVDTQLPFFN